MVVWLRTLDLGLDLVPMAILLIAMLQDTESGCLFTLISSTVYCFSGTAPGPYCIALLTVLLTAATIFRQSFLRKGFSATLLCVSASLLLYEAAVFLAGIITGHTFLQRGLYFVFLWLFTCILIPPFYPLMAAINKIGGNSWKE